MISDSEKQWSQLQKSGLCPQIQNLSDYRKATALNGLKLCEVINYNPIENPALLQILYYHDILFNEVHPWSGTLRKGNEMVIVAGLIACESQRIPTELKMLDLQFKTYMEKAQTPQDKMTAIAFYHARFERIHPFLDGNGRVGRMLMESQLTATFGKKVRPPLNREEYLLALAQCPKNLTPLTNLLLEREGLEKIQKLGPEKPVFRVAPFMVSSESTALSIDQELMRSKGADKSLGL
jgi:fido (protein-threonine AMPylation protein)